MRNPMSVHIETRNFNRHIRSFLRGTHVDTEKAIKKFAFDLLKKIIKKNPVNKEVGHGGRSRAGWFVAIEALGGSESGIASGNVSEIREGKALGGFTDNTKTIGNQWIEIINGVSYILFLEYGHSGQAPFGMARLSMREMRRGQLPQDMTRRMQRRWKQFYYQG